MHTLSLATLTLLMGCSIATAANDESDEDDPSEGRSAESVKVGAECSSVRSAKGYRKGAPLAIQVVDVDGKPVELGTAAAYLKLQAAAAADGVGVRVVSGFRTNEEQKTLYQMYLDGTGNLAAKPGYSNHQSGHALDLNRKSSGVSTWLVAHAKEFGFARTVPSEPWHYEYWGKTGDPCAKSEPAPPSSDPPATPAPSSAIYHPKPHTRWQIQLQGSLDMKETGALFDVDLVDTPQSSIDALRARGTKVICYFSAGSREDWRPDSASFSKSDYGKGLAGWPGENWLDVRSSNVRSIMRRRMDLAVSKRCDGVDPDNVDGYDNDTGLGITRANSIDYTRFLAREAHARSLSVGLKNALALIPEVVSDFDFAINEQCLVYGECDKERPFIDAGKAVFHIEYVAAETAGAAKRAAVCGNSSISGFSTLIKKQNDTVALDAWRLGCD